jgi:hypothetical protein
MRGLLLVVLAAGCVGAAHAGPSEPALRDELLQMEAQDQEVRAAARQGDTSRWRQVDAANQKRLKEIVARYGWPTRSMVGQEGADAAWLIAQHSDSDKDFQQKVLALMEPLVRQREVSSVNYAYLYDRTHYPQRYGTQGSCVSRQEWQPYEIEDIAHVNERRRELGLPSMTAYAARLTGNCANPNFGLHRAGDPKKTVPAPK